MSPATVLPPGNKDTVVGACPAEEKGRHALQEGLGMALQKRASRNHG
ncbi:MAG: hypothetical protein HN742_22115 [Lentisphaerae bacterium]|jgi:hypothetical protein|nr:hypothetical protein [Lentisphaerota bacterium]MBT4818086.1 hypothetical protein [Lentisphaerota bacterium]MBT5605254.1 hypothetical protein [Lentisphaerota bacterium]MBT7059233.1 hypothetical protein [Lentisphaerota bacterium]MBT7844588.1 hypothetical protein [Lentisphaerota bacterium]